jgi:hypothetical protein
MMTDIEILNNLEGIFNICLAAGHVKTTKDAWSLLQLKTAIEYRLNKPLKENAAPVTGEATVNT